MSDNWLQYIPADPFFQPSQAAAERARTLLAAFVPRADTVKSEFKASTEFFHPGGNWSGVKCPACGADAETWWQSAMRAAWKKQFADLNTTAGCCGALVSLNDLHYVWPAGFGRFVIEALNPGVRDLQPAEEDLLRKALGCDLRKIWVHL